MGSAEEKEMSYTELPMSSVELNYLSVKDSGFRD